MIKKSICSGIDGYVPCWQQLRRNLNSFLPGQQPIKSAKYIKCNLKTGEIPVKPDDTFESLK